MKNLKACPYCGGVCYYPTNIKKNKSITSCANNKCPIFGINMTLKQWNKRPAEDDFNEILNNILRTIEKVDTYSNKGPTEHLIALAVGMESIKLLIEGD